MTWVQYLEVEQNNISCSSNKKIRVLSFHVYAPTHDHLTKCPKHFLTHMKSVSCFTQPTIVRSWSFRHRIAMRIYIDSLNKNQMSYYTYTSQNNTRITTKDNNNDKFQKKRGKLCNMITSKILFSLAYTSRTETETSPPNQNSPHNG
jgi:hypothetical protein